MRDGLEISYLMVNPIDSEYLINKLKIVDNNSKKSMLKCQALQKYIFNNGMISLVKNKLSTWIPLLKKKNLAVKKAKKGVGDEELL